MIRLQNYQLYQLLKAHLKSTSARSAVTILLGFCYSVGLLLPPHFFLNNTCTEECRVDFHIEYREAEPIMRVDMNWARRIFTLLSQRINLNFVGTFYSVLGGAHSTLGRTDKIHATKAGMLARKQILLAQELGDLDVEISCWIYYAEYCIQVEKFNEAKSILQRQAQRANALMNEKLLAMCKSAIIKWETKSTQKIPPVESITSKYTT
ncbi:hypothetical protein K7432_017053 [Basidiobolus ranarum]|uniref:Uncharacterized protein n=1 Tax=Basidiobolus ranarum TaxID=34480 RepID=A0ABR2VKU4_9FUNG